MSVGVSWPATWRLDPCKGVVIKFHRVIVDKFKMYFFCFCQLIALEPPYHRPWCVSVYHLIAKVDKIRHRNVYFLPIFVKQCRLFLTHCRLFQENIFCNIFFSETTAIPPQSWQLLFILFPHPAVIASNNSSNNKKSFHRAFLHLFHSSHQRGVEKSRLPPGFAYYCSPCQSF